MKSKKNQEIRKRWQGIIAEAEQHPVSVKAYCRENGISAPSLYIMRGKLRKNQELKKSFSRVEILESRNARLPDAEWVATFVRSFLGVNQ